MPAFTKFDPAIRLSSPLDLDTKSEPDGTIRGYGATFDGEPDRQGDVIRKGAFARTLREHRAEGTQPALLWSHRLEQPVGKWLDIREDDRGLLCHGQINLRSAAGLEAYRHLENGDLDGLSIGFLLPPNGRRYLDQGMFEIRDLDLIEVSIVSAPSNRRARISSVKAIQSKGDLIDALHESGLPKRAAVKIANSGWAGLNGEDHQQKAKALLSAVEAATARIKRT